MMIHFNHTLLILQIDGSSIVGGTTEHLAPNHQNHLMKFVNIYQLLTNQTFFMTLLLYHLITLIVFASYIL